ncbi:hypothetical protein MASR2M29_09090 [Spirochaetota bacterium]
MFSAGKEATLEKSNNLLGKIRGLEAKIADMKELVLGNAIMLGEVPSCAGTWQSDDDMANIDYNVRARFFADRLSEMDVDECTMDQLGNPIGIIKGSDPSRPPILVTAELDSLFSPASDIHYSVSNDYITGPGLLDNALGAAAVLSVPDIIKRAGLSFKSNIILAGIPYTMKETKNLVLVDHFLASLKLNPSHAIIVKGGELGRLNYFSEAFIRGDISCERRPGIKTDSPNMIIIANEIIDRLLAIKLPQKPEASINIGILRSGYKYGSPATSAKIGVEIRSKFNELLKNINSRISNILDLVRHESRVDIEFDIGVSLGAESIGWNHLLTRAAIAIMTELEIEINVYPSVSELYYYLKRGISAITVGIAKGNDYHMENATAELSSIYKGLAQLCGLIMAVDSEAFNE